MVELAPRAMITPAYFKSVLSLSEASMVADRPACSSPQDRHPSCMLVSQSTHAKDHPNRYRLCHGNCPDHPPTYHARHLHLAQGYDRHHPDHYRAGCSHSCCSSRHYHCHHNCPKVRLPAWRVYDLDLPLDDWRRCYDRSKLPELPCCRSRRIFRPVPVLE